MAPYGGKVQCCRCKNIHLETDRKQVRRKDGYGHQMVCPRCGAHSYYAGADVKEPKLKTERAANGHAD